MNRKLMIAALLLVGACSKAPEADVSNETAATTEATPATDAVPAAETQVAAADAAPAAFAQCAACHSVEAGKNGLGPSLHGVVGRKSASVEGFNYSPAMKAANLTWDDATLDQYLAKPMTLVPGTRMSYPGQADAAKRAEIIAWLKTKS